MQGKFKFGAPPSKQLAAKMLS
eukprot:SAG11_NODE_35709_length_265_cov_0.921687_1_plen_21_part_10